MLTSMTVEEIKSSLDVLSPSGRNEVTAYLFYLRRKSDPEYQQLVQADLSGSDQDQWMKLEDFERKLDQG